MHQAPGSGSGNVSILETPFWVSGIYWGVWAIAGPHCVGGPIAGVLN